MQKYQLSDPKYPSVYPTTGRLPPVPPAERGCIAAGVPKLLELEPDRPQEGLFSKRKRFVADMLPALEVKLRQHFLDAAGHERRKHQPQLDFERRIISEVVHEFSDLGWGRESLVAGRTVIFLGLLPGFTRADVLEKFEPKSVPESDEEYGCRPMRPATEADTVLDSDQSAICMLSNDRAVLTFRDKKEAESGCYYTVQTLRTYVRDPKAFIVSTANLSTNEHPLEDGVGSLTALQSSLMNAYRMAARSASDHAAAYFNNDDNFSFSTASIITMQQDATELASTIAHAMDGSESGSSRHEEQEQSSSDEIRMLQADRMRMPIERDEHCSPLFCNPSRPSAPALPLLRRKLSLRVCSYVMSRRLCRATHALPPHLSLVEKSRQPPEPCPLTAVFPLHRQQPHPGLRSNVVVDPGQALSLVRFRRSLFHRTRSQWFSVFPPCVSRSVALAVSHAGCVVFLAVVLCPSRRLCRVRTPWRFLLGPASCQTLVRPPAVSDYCFVVNKFPPVVCL